MEKHHSCLNTKAIIDYFQERLPDRLPDLLEGLGPEIEGLEHPKEFLLEINNWVSSEVVIRMFENARRLTKNDNIAFDIGFQSAARQKLGYVQRLILFAYKNPRRTLQRLQAINDRFNRNKTIEVEYINKETAIIRLRWALDIPASLDFCLFNQGIYSGIPTIWNLPPAWVEESKCFFRGDAYCEFRFQWHKKSWFREFLTRLASPWPIVKSTIVELERDKELLKKKFEEVHRLNLQLNEKIKQNTQLYRKLEISERKYRELVENAHEGIWIVGDDGNINFANRRMKEIIGEEHLEGREYREFFQQENLQLSENILKQNRQGLVVQEELEITSKNRGQVAVYLSSVPLMEHGLFMGAFAMFSDISDKKAMEKQLLQQQKMEAVGTLAAGIAHNFNNLLMNIMGLTGLVLTTMDLHDPSYADLKQIEQEVIKGSAMAKQLLSFSRGGTALPKPINLNGLVDATAKLFCRARRDLVLSMSLAAGLPAVEADPSQMEQVLMNLLVNAWQAMAGRGEMVLSTEVVDLSADFSQPLGRPAGRYVHLAVADSGPGMEPAVASRIFEPFFTTKEVSQGTGLGLATVYAIIKNHKGIIQVQSELQRGTTFHIYLPVSEKPVAAEKPSDSRFVRGSGTVLLVDDEERIRVVGKRILEQLGYQILLAENGHQALSLYQDHQGRIDLIILDLVMPGLGGRETYQKIKQINDNAKVLLSSGNGLEGEAQQIMESGAQGFIQKPYRLEALSRKVAEILKS